MNHQGHPPVRIFLFKREFTDASELRRAIGMSFPEGLLNVLDANDDGLRTACTVVRSTPRRPGLVIVERERREPRSIDHLSKIRELLELRALPLVVLGYDHDDSHAMLGAYEDGADGFVAIPPRITDLTRVGNAVAKIWGHLQLVQSA